MHCRRNDTTRSHRRRQNIKSLHQPSTQTSRAIAQLTQPTSGLSSQAKRKAENV